MQLSPLRYPGGKSKACKILEKYLPEEFETVVSPFFGGGSFENYLSLKGKKVIGYDFCEPVANFWDQYINNKDAVFEGMENLSSQILSDRFCGEISKDLREEQRSVFFSWRETATGDGDPLSRAVCYFALNRSSFSGMSLIAGPMSTKWIEQKMGERALKNLREIEFQVERVEYRSCFEVIPDSKCDLMYLDPPYIMETVEKEGIYGEGGDMHRGFDHETLLEQLKSYKGRWILSYLNVPRVKEMYKDFNIHEEEWTYVMKPGKGVGKNPKGKELVITNF